MALSEWKAEYNLGIASIDRQHRRLVDMINALDDGLNTQGRYSEPVLKSIFVELGDYTASHFSYEENLFEIHGYADTEAHKQEHLALLDQVVDLQMRVQSGETEIGPELLAFLKRWLTSHILGSDRRYAGFLIDKGVE